ncbi:MAG: hypothetical protein EOM41_01110 [Bacilli bacterium]|nr:hypothetical protein [Bacilli bacterium]
MAQEYKHFRRKLDFIKYLIDEKKAPIDLNKTMRLGGAWWIDNEGKQFKALNSREFLKMLDEAYNLNIDYDKSVARGYKVFIIFDKPTTTTKQESVEAQVVGVEKAEETTPTVEDTEVKASKRGSRKPTTAK